MARAHYRDTIIGSVSGSTSLNALGSATVYVYQTGTTSVITQTLYAAASGGTTLSNPLTADANGVVEFWLDTDERVDLAISKTGYTSVTVTVEVVAQSSLSSPTFQDPTDTTKQADLDLSGATTGTKTTLTFAQTANRVLTFPNGTDTLAGLAATQEFTNKTLNAAVAKGTWTASGTWTIPAVTLGGTLTATGQAITGGTFGSPTLTTPTIADFTNANHTHAASGATGGAVDAGTLAGTTLKSTVVTSSLTSVGTLTGLTSSGTAYIGDTANAGATLGLTINQGAADDEILALKSSDVAHGMTSHTETDTYGLAQKQHATNGGMRLAGFSGLTIGLMLQAWGVTDNTTKSTAAQAYAHLDTFKKSGTSAGAPGADANLFAIAANSTVRFIFDVEGSAHADVEWTTFDDFNDAALLDSLEHALVPTLGRDPLQDAFGQAVRYSREQLEAAGIIGRNSYRETGDGKARAMLNMTRLTMALVGALRQTHDRLAVLEARALEAA